MKKGTRKFNTTKQRVAFLQKILDGDIELQGGTLRYLKDAKIFDEPCKIGDLVRKLGGKMNVIGSGGYGKVFKICVNPDCKNDFVLKQAEIRGKDQNEYFFDVNYPANPENVEVALLKLLNDFLFLDITPHVPLYMGDFMCNTSGQYHRYIIAEKADGTLSHYIKGLEDEPQSTNELKMKVIFFQLIYTLRVIQQRYPNFMHSDLHPNNILYFKTDPGSESRYHSYTVDGKTYILPDVGIRVAIWDFDMGSINGIINNAKAEVLSRDGFAIQTEQNQFMDVYKLLNIFLNGFGLNVRYNLKAPKAKSFARKYIPYGGWTCMKLSSYGGLIPNLQVSTPRDVLKDPYFGSFAEGRQGANVKSMVTHKYSDILGKNVDFQKLAALRVHNVHKYTTDCPKIRKNKIPIFSSRKPLVGVARFASAWYNKEREEFCLRTKNNKSMMTPEKYEAGAKKIIMKWLEEVYHEIVHIPRKETKELKGEILSLTMFLVTKFVEDMYLPREFGQLIGIIALDKAIFYILQYHKIDVEFMSYITDGAYTEVQVVDSIIQFNEYLLRKGIEKKYMKVLSKYDELKENPLFKIGKLCPSQ